MRNTRKTDSLRRHEDRVFVPGWRRASAAFALMSITLQLTPEEETLLAAIAGERGVPPDVLVQDTVKEILKRRSATALLEGAAQETFRAGRSIAGLAVDQNIQPVRDSSALAGFPADEDIEAFVAAIYEARK